MEGELVDLQGDDIEFDMDVLSPHCTPFEMESNNITHISQSLSLAPTDYSENNERIANSRFSLGNSNQNEIQPASQELIPGTDTDLINLLNENSTPISVKKRKICSNSQENIHSSNPTSLSSVHSATGRSMTTTQLSAHTYGGFRDPDFFENSNYVGYWRSLAK